MADTYTTNLNLTKPEPGAAEDTWGISLNADLDSLDAIFGSGGTAVSMGAVTLDGLTVNGNPHISVGDTNTQYIQFGSTAIDNRIGVAAYDSIYIEVDRNNANPNSSIVHKIDNKSRLLIQDTGDISFYDDTGTSQNLKCTWKMKDSKTR